MPITNGKYVNPGWVNGQAPAINSTELNAISDTLQSLDSIGGTRGGYVVVGTSTAGATVTTCDFLCDGTADDVEINAAIQQAQSLNMPVLLLNGTYNIANTIQLSGQMRGISPSATSLNRTSASFQYLVLMNDNSEISDITLNSTPGLESDSCAEIYHGNRCSIKNISLLSFPYIGILSPGDSSSSGGNYSSVIIENVSTLSIGGTRYGLRMIKCASDSSPCFVRNCSFTNTVQLISCGVQSGVFVMNCSFSELSLTNSQMCLVANNTFSENFTLTQSGSSFKCAANIVSANSFYGDMGITLSSGTERNLIIGNGGGVLSPWAGVTDNGSNNYVANNMPT